MYLENRQYQLTISESPLSNGPWDVIWDPENLGERGEGRSLAVSVRGGPKPWRGLLTDRRVCMDRVLAVLEEHLLTVLLDGALTQLDLRQRSVRFHRRLVEFGSCFGLYPCPPEIGGYLIWGELEIVRLNARWEKEWDAWGADIFASSDGQPAFEIKNDRIVLRDWLGNCYELDYSGKTLLFLPSEEYLQERSEGEST